MSKSNRVFNETRGSYTKLHQAAMAVEACAAVWVEYGVSIRHVTLAEAIALRNEQAARGERLAFAELPGLVYEPGITGIEGHRNERRLAVEAGVFATTGVYEGRC